jgi:N-methylhydantoinase A
MSVARGIDPRGLALMAFGGAGPLHAAALARHLGITRVLCPRASGVLCALGLAAAAPRRDAARTVMLGGSHDGSLSPQRLSDARDALIAEASAALSMPPSRVRVRYELRYHGQSFELPVDEEPAPGGGLDPDGLRAAFARAHQLRYGYHDDDADVEVVNMRASVWGPSPSLRPLAASAQAGSGQSRGARVRATDVRPIVFDGEVVAATVLRGELPPGTRVSGPALCALPDATLLVPPGWSGEVDKQGTVHLESANTATGAPITTRASSV